MQERMTDQPLISIVIPCYNCSALVEETLDSLAAQSLRNFEVICINDGSRDDTLAVLQAYRERSKLQMRILDQENAGVSATRNRGIAQACGKYILFLDADDLYHSDFVRSLVRAVEESGADTAYCLLSRAREALPTHALTEITHTEQSQEDAMHTLLYRMGEVGFYCYLYRRDLLTEQGILFDEDTKFGEDREFNWKYLCHCKRIAFVDAILYWYRPNMASATKSKASWRHTDALTAMRRVEAYMKQLDCAYLQEFSDYMYPRVMWTVAKNFSVCRDRELFARLQKEYDVRTCMRRTAKDPVKLVALASRFYLIHPRLFYATISFAMRIKRG